MVGDPVVLDEGADWRSSLAAFPTVQHVIVPCDCLVHLRIFLLPSLHAWSACFTP